MNYGSHYLSAPGLNWDAVLKITKTDLELFQILTCIYFLRKVQEVEFLIFLSNRYSKAYKKYLKSCDPKQ